MKWNKNYTWIHLSHLSLFIALYLIFPVENAQQFQQMHCSTFKEEFEKNFFGIQNELVLIN